MTTIILSLSLPPLQQGLSKPITKSVTTISRILHLFAITLTPLLQHPLTTPVRAHLTHTHMLAHTASHSDTHWLQSSKSILSNIREIVGEREREREKWKEERERERAQERDRRKKRRKRRQAQNMHLMWTLWGNDKSLKSLVEIK